MYNSDRFQHYKNFVNPKKIIRALTSYRTFRTVIFANFILPYEPIRNLYIKFVGFFKGKNKKLLKIYDSNRKNAEILLELKRNGFALLGNLLSQNEIDNIINALSNEKCFDPYFPNNKPFFPHEADFDKVHIGHYSRRSLLQIKSIMDVANNPQLLSIVQEYLGMKPLISNVSLWWSFCQVKAAKEAQNFHRDRDDVKFLKFFIYLTDVDDGAGPHWYIKGSHLSNHFRRPYGNRYSDEETLKLFSASDLVAFKGDRGTAFIEDTFGIHKGFKPQNKNRLLLQIQYSIDPLPGTKYDPIELSYTADYDPYINHLLIKPAG